MRRFTSEVATRAALPCAALLLVAAPFGEGGRRPDVLAALHLLALLLGLAAAVALCGSPGRHGLRGRGNGLLLVALAAPAWSCVPALFAPFRDAALFGLMDRLTTALAFVAGAALFGDAVSLARLRTIAIAATTLQAAIVLVLQAAGAVAGTPGSGPADAARIFLNRSHLAAYLAFGFLLAAAAALGSWRRGARRAATLAAAAAAVHLAAILPLQSRGALLALGCGGLGLLAVSWGTLPRRARVALVAGAAIVALSGALLVLKRFRDNDDPDRYTRFTIWRASLAMAFEHPVLGLGPGQFPHEAPKHNFPLERSPVRYARQFSGAHSLPLTLLAEDGGPGLLLLAAAIAAILVTLLRGPRRSPGSAGRLRAGDSGGAERDAILGAGAAIVALAAQGCVEDLQERPAILLTAALLAGSAVAFARGWRLRARDPLPATGAAAGGEDASTAVPNRFGVDPVGAALVACAACLAIGGAIRPWLSWREASAARSLGAAGLPRLERAARLDPLNPWHREGLAMAALQGGPADRERYAAAAIHLDEARRLAPGEPRLALLRARLEALAARTLFPVDATVDRASALYAEAVRLAPRDPRPRLEQAGWLAGIGRAGEARATLEAAMAIEPNYRRARILLTSLLEQGGDRDAAQRSYDALLASDEALRDYTPDSGYAAEIARDAPEERQRIAVRFPALSHGRDAS